MMSKIVIFLSLLIIAPYCVIANVQKCVPYSQPVSFTGTLYSRLFAGPPNYESIKRGDAKETAIILKLANPTCTIGDGSDSFDISYSNIREMQLVIYNDDKSKNDKQWKVVDRRMGKRVVVTGTLFGAHTGHHRTKVLIQVSDIRLSDSLKSTVVKYPAVWFAVANDSKKPAWEILPQEARAGEVILSKRNELGILSNFAATPFEMDGQRYASVEGYWQMMLYPDGPGDERGKDTRVTWKYTREQVAQMIGFEAMRAKLGQNPEVKRILLGTGDLILKPDHHGEENPPPEWKYNEIWMQLRTELRAKAN